MEQMINAGIPWNDGNTKQDDLYSDLAAAIITQTVKDYIKVLRKLWKKNAAIEVKRKLVLEKLELEGFFHSSWYEMLTEIDPDRLISRCQEVALEQEKEHRRMQAKKHRKEQMQKGQEENANETGQSIT